MTLRDYLSQMRNKYQLTAILTDLVQGVIELHELGFVHRDLKPENVMINFEPVRAVVIDFNRAVRRENITEATTLGTRGYFPLRQKWLNGSTQWDVWSIVAIMLECDMRPEAYLECNNESDTIESAIAHCSSREVSETLKKLV